MKKFLIILVLFSNALYSTNLYAQSTDSVSVYKLSVTSVPENCDVYLNDSTLIGKTPVNNYELKSAQYKLTVISSSELREWDKPNKVIAFNLVSDTTFNVTFSGEYFINTSPSNAEVTKNDTSLGFTPLRLFTKEKLSGKLILKKNGYFDKAIDMTNIDFGKSIFETLTPNGTPLKTEVWKNRSTSFNTKRNFPVIALLGAALIGETYGAFTFKAKANDAYDRYLQTYSKTDYDESNTNDTYSLLFVIAGQITLGALIYFLFID